MQQAVLEHGQSLRFGSVELLFQSDAPAPAAAPVAGEIITIPSAPVPRMRPAGLRISGAAHAAPEAPAAEPAGAPPLAPPVIGVAGGARFCKFHPKSTAHYLCNKCNRTFCELCVNTRHEIKTCRSCGGECTPLHVEYAAPADAPGFFAQLPGAFIYPFKGTGLLVLIVATLIFAALSRVGWFAILLKIASFGYFFSYNAKHHSRDGGGGKTNAGAAGNGRTVQRLFQPRGNSVDELRDCDWAGGGAVLV